MHRILVPPDVILRVSEQFNRAAEHLEYVKETLSRQIHMLTNSWDGTTKQRFYEDFHHVRREMELTIERQRFVGKELQQIAFRFITADGQETLMNPDKFAELLVKMPPPAPEPKTWEDHAEDFLQGVKAGGIALADSLVDTGKALYEDPIGASGDMLYNATIGTAEEIIDTSIWGTKMIFDVGDTREKFDEKIEGAGGFSNLAGQQTAMILGGAMLRRVGVKGSGPGIKHGLDADTPKRVGGVGQLNTFGDALRKSLGPAKTSHAIEYVKILKHAEQSGVQIELRKGALAYEPSFGSPGRLILDPEASIGAVRHEYRHMLDDFDLGHPGMRIIADSDLFWSLEFRGYMEEIKIAREIRDYDAGRFILQEMRTRRREILGR